VSKYLEVLPGIAVFINANFDKNDLLISYDTFLNTGEEDLQWRMKGDQMNFTIYWARGEVFHQWHCHCYTEENF
jgi:hypothetical protein